MKYKAVFASLALASAFAVAQPNGIVKSGIQDLGDKIQSSTDRISANSNINSNANQSININAQSLIEGNAIVR